MDSMHLIPYIDDERLGAYAASCARTLRVEGSGDGRAAARRLHRRLQEAERCHKLISRRYENAAHIPAACEWLLDNRWLLQREVPGALRALRACPRQRRCRDGLLVTELCRALLQAGNGAVTAGRCRIFLQGFQSVTVLQRRELLLFPAALRAAVLEGIAAQCVRLRAAADPEALTDAMAALFTSLRLLGETDTDAMLEEADVCSALLARESAGVYPRMDRATRSAYLDRLAELARRRSVEEQTLAAELLEKAEREGVHVGFLLFPQRGELGAGLYIAALLLLTLSCSLFLAFSLDGPRLAPLLLVPVWALIKGLVDFVLLQFAAPRRLPRLDPDAGVPPEGKTLCVLSVLLGCCDAKRLEELRLLSRREGKNLLFGLLADLPAASEEKTPEDEALLEDARRTVEELNRRYGGGFYLFTRSRRFDGEQFCGHERKRGALLELARLLGGEASALRVTGDAEALAGTRFILSLDADTRAAPGAFGELIAAALHPLNAPRLSEDGRVRAGYGILHPRIEMELASATSTDFSLIFAGPGGCDPYGGLNGELFMDAFDCGGFAGKGLIDAKLLLACTGRLPEGRILSHDALEGALLRGGYLSDAAVSDAFPDTPLAYFKRQHRWIRGDWQNAPWIFCRGFSRADRFRLLDSLLRSLLPPATLCAILLGFFSGSPGLALAAWAALLALVQSLLLALAASGFTRRRRGERLRRHARLLTGVGGAIVRCFMRLWLLPFEAWVCLSAILTALWRMTVSHRRLLQWQTAAESRGGRGLAAHVRAMWPAVVLGVLLTAFSPAVIGKSAGLLWLLSPAAAAALALPAARVGTLSARDRELLFSAINDGFSYFRELCTEEDHFLPPDNFQQSPPLGAAHRTSPTNIALAMASAAALGETGMLSREEAVNFLGRIIETLEGMDRYAGHFYNWYDTQTLRPMEPRVISTVDSGNLCAALYCARAALDGWGCEALSKRLEALIDAMDFSPFYDKKRELLLISYDPLRKSGTDACYDLMASEAMLTSYLAVARGQVPLRHWRRLSRAQVQKDGFRGLASWTGTMFEYLMPALFLPLYPSSLLHESARFCLYVQKRRHLPGRPWGVSESAFCALDPSLSYRYKAHGCPELALRRGMEEELVIAPYASFLALAVDPAAALRNLRRLRELGLWGRWGLIEALDFTPGRCTHPDGEPVSCWMAHHVGMSILAAVNALEDGAVRRLFLTAPELSACTLLLQEKLPDDGPLLRRGAQSVPERPRKALCTPWSLRGGEADKTPRASLLSNGVYSLRLANTGESAAFLGELCVYRAEGCPRFTLVGESVQAAFPAAWEFGEESCRLDREAAGVRLSLVRQCAAGELGESLLLALRSDRDQALPLALDFTPVLARERDWLSHRAYWQLGLTAEQAEGKLLLRRLPKNGLKELWLCVGADVPLRFEAASDGAPQPLTLPRVRCEALPVLRRGRELRIHFALCLAATRHDALAGAGRMLAGGRGAAGAMLRCAAQRLSMSAAQLGEAMELVLPLWQNRLADACPRRELWRWGVSGELPLLCCAAEARESEALLRAFCLLKSCGLEAELVFLSAEAGAYRRPVLARLEKVLASVGLEALLGTRGGVFFLRAVRPEQAEESCRGAQERAQRFAGRLRIEGVPPAFAHMVNVWAPYQALVCRLLGRASLYQSGGAVGFRDQLQDCVNLLLLSNTPARRQILDCCRHQYREGDVQHWWHRHPSGDRGIRSRCSDDLLWLVWALCEYVRATGDAALCAEKESWLSSPPLRPDERDRYETPARTQERASVLEHAAAALERCAARGFGPHGLPFMGSGDWNDALDRADGESVWLGWFLSCCADDFAALLERLGDRRARRYRALAERVGRAAEASFNGRWYPRVLLADGRALGDGEAIDALAQSWAVFCPYADRAHAETALDSALSRLVDREHRLVRLLDPPYTTENSPGYISAYGEGFRENGGQYTHAAIWLALAALRLGRREEGAELLRMLLPETHDIARYEAEPFVLPADVCAAKGCEGTAGWTWYTGSAGWFYRAVTGELLGLRLEDGKLCAKPGALGRYRVRWLDGEG